MSAVARSLVVFGWYLVGLAALLVVVPNLVLGLFGLPPTDEVWIRVVGVLVLIIGYYNVRLGRTGLVPYARLTVHARVAVLVFFVGFVLAGLAKPILLLIGAVDLAGALWTAAALREERPAASRALVPED
jgi:hypothetical protein